MWYPEKTTPHCYSTNSLMSEILEINFCGWWWGACIAMFTINWSVLFNAERKIKPSPVKYFNQRFLNYKQNFVSEADHILFVDHGLEEHNLNLSVSFTIQKITHHNLQLVHISIGTDRPLLFSVANNVIICFYVKCEENTSVLEAVSTMTCKKWITNLVYQLFSWHCHVHIWMKLTRSIRRGGTMLVSTKVNFF